MDEWMPCSKLDRRKPTRKKTHPHFGRKVAKIVGLAILALVVGLTLRKVVRPFKFYYTESRNVHELERQNKALQEENRRLRRQRAYLLSKDGAEVEARKLGWALPGERTLVLEKDAGRASSKSTNNPE